jgi:hypothetical protein
VSLRSRLQRLERACGKGGRCPRCRDRPAVVVRTSGSDSAAGPAVAEENEDGTGEACPACGWSPVVTRLVEIVVESPEEVVRLATREGAGEAE